MKKMLLIAIAVALLTACTPVLDRVLMKEGAREFSLSHLKETPEVFQGKLFILGGLIVETRLTEKGSQIESVAMPVDSWGYLQDNDRSKGRFLAIYPKSHGLLDPMIYRKGREVTLAGEFVELRKGKIDEMEYTYPVFEIREIYLWDEHREYHYPPTYYPYYYRSPFLYDPWGRPYPNPYWPQGPW